MKIMILAMGRSGHHAIIRWIAQGLDGKVVLENNCVQGWDQKKHIPNKTISIQNDGEGEHIIRNIEDFYLPLWDAYNMDSFDNYDHKIIIIRNFDNWLASSIAAGGWAKDYLSRRPRHHPIELPVSRLDAYIAYGEELTNNSRKFKSIIYDLWFQYENTRKLIANILNIKNTELPKHCKFSSFGKNHDYVGDRKELLNNSQKELFYRLCKLYQSYLMKKYGD